jgi:ferrochelatase
VQAKNGVLLLNLGGPETLDDVRPFLYNLFADPDIIRLPAALQFLQPILANVIATLRAPKSSEGYASIGGGSPLRRITDEQAQALAKALKARGLDAEVYVAMRYWHPYTEEALQHVIRDGIQNLVILPLYPQFSISTSGSSLRLLEHLFKSDPVLQNLKHTVIPSWYQRPGYVGAMVDLIEAELDKFDDPAQVGNHHSTSCSGSGMCLRSKHLCAAVVLAVASAGVPCKGMQLLYCSSRSHRVVSDAVLALHVTAGAGWPFA